jgi:hypothetical protein
MKETLIRKDENGGRQWDIHDKDLSRENTPLPVFIGRVS